jgi:hypothetical protein
MGHALEGCSATEKLRDQVGSMHTKQNLIITSHVSIKMAAFIGCFIAGLLSADVCSPRCGH